MTKRKAPEEKKTGRPTDYKAEYPELLISHFKVDPYTLVVMESSTEYNRDGSIKKKTEKKQKVANKMPTLFNFSQTIGVNYRTVWRWAHEKDAKTQELIHLEFSHAYNAAKELQKDFLISLGLSGSAPPASFIFVAKNVTDMRDKTEVANTLNFSLSSLFDQAQARRKELEAAEGVE